MSDKTFYVTTPIYYVNARPHIGHAYTTIVADVLARRHRLLGEDTFFLTGTDEHGQKIERSAAAAGIPPQQFADQVSKSFEDLWKRMGITNNAYIRTTDPKHKQGVQHLFSELYKNGFIYLASYTGAYCVSDEAFVDAPIGTPCPDCGRLLEEVTEENFFFKLSAFQRPLLDLIESNTLSITPDSRRNEVLSFLRGDYHTVVINYVRTSTGQDSPVAYSGNEIKACVAAGLLGESAAGTAYVPGALKDLSISRSSFTWGIPVPEPAASTAKQPHVIYVWLDALANYMTTLGYGSDDTTLFDKFWPADLHLVGKEIIRFHCVYWPAFLLALNPAYASRHSERSAAQPKNPDAPGPAPAANTFSTPDAPPPLTFDQHKLWAKKMLPKAVTAHGWLLFEDSKMSKSRGNIVRTETILDAFGTLCPPTPTPDAVTPPNAVILSEARSAQPKDPDAQSPAKTAHPISTENPTPHERDLFASDVLRYFLLREIPFGQDGSFSFDALITRYNADLANGYGNLVSRTLKLIEQNLNGLIVEPKKPWTYGSKTASVSSDATTRVAQQITETDSVIQVVLNLEEAREHYEETRFELLTQAVSARIKIVDMYLSSHEPWKLAKSDNEEDQRGNVEVLYTAAESIRIITALLYPILPYATARVWQQLGFEKSIEQAAADGELKNLTWGGLKPGTQLGPLGPIFPRADKGLAQIMTDMENPTPVDKEPVDPAAVPPTTDPAAPPRTSSIPEPITTLPVGGSTALTTGPDPAAPPPGPSTLGPEPSPQITIDDFAKIELRVAQILVAERIPKADKLLRLEVDLGPHGKRQILSGIAEWYAPEDLIGRRIVVITNLAPRKMRGLESHGMLLAASHGEGDKPVLATFGEDIALGSRLK